MKDPFDGVTSDMFEPRKKVTKAPSIPYKEGMARDAAAKTAAAEAISKASGKSNLAPLPEGMPKLTEAIAKADAERAERAERKAAKAAAKGSSGGGGGGDFSGMKGLDKPFKAGGKVSSASKRADGCAVRGKTRA
jgi:hypothetical protein